MSPDTKINAVILAGGSGTRLWPLSRLQLPKQFLKLYGDEVLLEATISRISDYVLKNDVLVVTNEQHAKGEAYDMLSAYQTLLEPQGRNTAPAIAVAAAWLQKHSGADPVMLVLPADHVIQDQAAFNKVIEQAIAEAEKGALVTFGICPTRPDTGFGYIKTASIESSNNSLPAERFVEKPDVTTAEKYLAEGNYFWNSGMFVWKASSILKQIETWLPEVDAVMKQITAAWDKGEEPQQVVDRLFSSMPNISIDYGVLEKVAGNSDDLLVIPSNIAWSDIGSWDAVHDILNKDDAKNLLQGNVLALDCKNTLIHSSNRLVTAVGVDDLCVVETADAILLTKMGETQRVREVVDSLKQQNAQEHIMHLTVKRPWGSYTVLEEFPGYKLKRLTVNPGAKLSLQRHQHRSEHWTVVAGTATVTCGEKIMEVMTNESTFIPAKEMHQLENQGAEPLQMIEVQVGSYLGEDDIERFDDKYGRV